MSDELIGSWKLLIWQQIAADGSKSYPFGEDPEGLLIYAPDGYMAVQMLTVNRPQLQTTSATGGSIEERAAAYSSCLAYFGKYQVVDGVVIHSVAASLFPNWSNTEQHRPYTLEDNRLTLRTPMGPGVTVENEIIWERLDIRLDIEI
jgi:hypothetical protein